MSTTDNYTLVAYVKSNSTSTPRPVKSDGVRLTCACPGWTRRIAPDGSRSCRHTDEIDAQLKAAHLTVRQAVSLLKGGTMAVANEHETLTAVLDPIVVAVEGFRSKWGLTMAVRADAEALVRKFAGAMPKPLAPAAPSRPAWLGGGRAIILRE